MDCKKSELKDRLAEALALREKKAADLVRDLKIPKSAISQYLSGKSQNMDSKRLNAICRYLNVSEPWLLGYDVDKKRPVEQVKMDKLARHVHRLRGDEKLLNISMSLCNLNSDQLSIVEKMVNEFNKINTQ